MSKQRELEDRVLAAHAAQAFIQNPQFVQAVEDLRTAIFNDWVASDSQAPEYREALWHRWHALDDVMKGLRKPVGDGTLAAKELEVNRYQANLE